MSYFISIGSYKIISSSFYISEDEKASIASSINDHYQLNGLSHYNDPKSQHSQNLRRKISFQDKNAPLKRESFLPRSNLMKCTQKKESSSEKEKMWYTHKIKRKGENTITNYKFLRKFSRRNSTILRRGEFFLGCILVSYNIHCCLNYFWSYQEWSRFSNLGQKENSSSFPTEIII